MEKDAVPLLLLLVGWLVLRPFGAMEIDEQFRERCVVVSFEGEKTR